MSSEEIDENEVQIQLGSILSMISIDPDLRVPRNYEPEHLEKFTIAQLFQLRSSLEKLAATQEGLPQRTTGVCINRINTTLSKKV